MLAIFLYMYFPDRGCVHTLLTLYVYATAVFYKQIGRFASTAE